MVDAKLLPTDAYFPAPAGSGVTWIPASKADQKNRGPAVRGFGGPFPFSKMAPRRDDLRVVHLIVACELARAPLSNRACKQAAYLEKTPYSNDTISSS